MTHILEIMFGNVEVVCTYPNIIYKITTDICSEEILKCKLISEVREEDNAELVSNQRTNSWRSEVNNRK
jgi:hypothetical protein